MLGVGLLLTVGTGFFVASEFSLVNLDRSELESRQGKGEKGLTTTIGALRITSTHLSSAQLGITLTTLLTGYTMEPAISRLISPPLVGAATGPWGVSGWGYPQTREHPNGTTIFIFGILGIVVCGLLGPVAWVMGSRALSEMTQQPATVWTNRGQVRAGQVCGIISTCLFAFSAVILALLLATGVFFADDFRQYSSCRATLASAQSASVAYWSDNDTWPRRFSDLTDDFYMTLRADTRETADSTAITNGDWTITMRGGGLRETTFDTVGC